MVGAVKAGEDLARQIIITSELFYQRKTQLRFLRAIKDVLSIEVEWLEKEEEA